MLHMNLWEGQEVYNVIIRRYPTLWVILVSLATPDLKKTALLYSLQDLTITRIIHVHVCVCNMGLVW